MWELNVQNVRRKHLRLQGPAPHKSGCTAPLSSCPSCFDGGWAEGAWEEEARPQFCLLGPQASALTDQALAASVSHFWAGAMGQQLCQRRSAPFPCGLHVPEDWAGPPGGLGPAGETSDQDAISQLKESLPVRSPRSKQGSINGGVGLAKGAWESK